MMMDGVGERLGGGFWQGGFLENFDISVENVGKVRLVWGPEVLEYGMGGLLGVWEFVEESPFGKDDFYLIRSIFGTDGLAQHFVRVGGFVVEDFALYGSYEWVASDGTRLDFRRNGLEDKREFSRYAVVGEWGGEDSRVVVYVLGSWGEVYPTAFYPFFWGRREVRGIRHNLMWRGRRGGWSWRVRYGVGRSWRRLRDNEVALRRSYGREPELGREGMYVDFRLDTFRYRLGDWRHWGVGGGRLERERYSHFAMEPRTYVREWGYGYYRHNLVWRDIFLFSLVGAVGKVSSRRWEFSFGGQCRFLFGEGHRLRFYVYRHWREPVVMALRGRIFYPEGVLYLRGSGDLSSLRVEGLGVDYIWEGKLGSVEGRGYMYRLLGREVPW
ncbi:MAG: hypothetical protein D6805_03860, partial [Planctomycetota bacterium]